MTKRPLILDLTRLVRRAHHPTPTGIDRIEHIWAKHLCGLDDKRVIFQAWVPGLGRRELPKHGVESYLSHLSHCWGGQALGPDWRAVLRLMGKSHICNSPEDSICLSLSHQMLHEAVKLRQSRPKNGKLVIFLHDLIPSEFPEYARPGGAAKHDLRIKNSLSLADGIIVNSQTTAESVSRFASGKFTIPPLHVAPFGVESVLPPTEAKGAGGKPYFLCVGTIEPRKNHLLLLQAWRRMAETLPHAEIPKLILVGRRGWENENIVDLLDRCAALRDLVEERGRASDQEMRTLLLGARAVLLPSFAEGFGLPVIEALSVSVPVIASDLPVFREFAGDVPDYADPLDGPAWIRHILDYAHPHSSMRARQVERIRDWIAPCWSDHFGGIFEFLDRL